MIHAIFDVTGCQHANADPEAIMTAMRRTAGLLGCTTRAQVIEPFQPHGATCVLILAESHITVSTWPEHQLAHIDVFTCRADSEPGHAIQPILDLLAGQVSNTQNVPRTPPGSLLLPEAFDETVPRTAQCLRTVRPRMKVVMANSKWLRSSVPAEMRTARVSSGKSRSSRLAT